MKTIEWPCPHCEGYGWLFIRAAGDPPEREHCGECWGSGVIEVQVPDPNDILKDLLCDSK